MLDGVFVMKIAVYSWDPPKYALYVLWYDYGGFLGPGYVGETVNLPSRIYEHLASKWVTGFVQRKRIELITYASVEKGEHIDKEKWLIQNMLPTANLEHTGCQWKWHKWRKLRGFDKAKAVRLTHPA